MAKRIITGLIGLIVFFVAFFANEFIFSIAVAIVSVGMVYEAVDAIKPGKTVSIISIFLSVIFLMGVIIVQKTYNDYILLSDKQEVMGIAKMIILLAFMAVYSLVSIFVYMIVSVKEFLKQDVHKIFTAGFMTIYISLFMAFIMFINFEYGRYAVLPVFIFSWITDTGAYFTGSFLGKHKMAPNLSPKKTIEGAIGGVVITVIGAAIYVVVLDKGFNIQLPSTLVFLIAAAVGAVLSELGDLSASAVKRHCGVKDFGKIFPGHGGFLDRFDSVVFIAPYVYFVFLLMEHATIFFR